MAKWTIPDMIPRSQVDAMVAAKLTEAVDLVWRRSGPTLSKQVRALITEDAQTALAKMLAEARADRIEELEAKLAKALTALVEIREFVKDLEPYAEKGHTLVPALQKACLTLAELTGEKK